MDPIAYYYLLGFGFLLLGIEILLFSFYLLWIALGFIAVAFLSLIVNFENGLSQITIALLLGLILLYFFKKPLQALMQSQKHSEQAIHQSGVGTIVDGAIKMDGTFWQTDDDLTAFANGDKVEVSIEGNKAKLL